MAKKLQNINDDPIYGTLREFKATQLTFDTLIGYGAHSMGIGRKVVKGKATDQLCLRFYVENKRPLSKLPPNRRIPSSFRYFSRKMDGEVDLLTDVIELPQPRFSVNPSSQIRPVPGGVSGGTLLSGTIGGWVWDATDDTFVMLSNYHIFNPLFGPNFPHPIVQPSQEDGGTEADIIGQVKRGIFIHPEQVNTVDCAIGEPNSLDLVQATVLEIGWAVFAIESVVMDMPVEKFGQTTQHTLGEVVDDDWQGIVLGMLGTAFYAFSDCIVIEADSGSQWAADGDSGSIVFSQAPIPNHPLIKPAVGLHFASMNNQVGLACKIDNVFNQLDLEPVCGGLFALFMDSMFEVEAPGQVKDGTEKTQLRSVSTLTPRAVEKYAPPPFVPRERRRHRARSLHRGMARDIQKRLMSSSRGRVVTDFVDRYRAELASLLISDGDVRRATVAAVKPLIGGATTTTDVLERVLTEEDLQRLDKLAQEVSRKSGPELKAALKLVTAFRPGAEGKSVAEILGIQV